MIEYVLDKYQPDLALVGYPVPVKSWVLKINQVLNSLMILWVVLFLANLSRQFKKDLSNQW